MNLVPRFDGLCAQGGGRGLDDEMNELVVGESVAWEGDVNRKEGVAEAYITMSRREWKYLK
jgi:hypothetical protein